MECPECGYRSDRREAVENPLGGSVAAGYEPEDTKPKRVAARSPSNRARVVADGGRVQLPGFGRVKPRWVGVGAVVAFLGLRALGGGSGGREQPVTAEQTEDGEQPVWVEESDGEVECPECGEEYSKNGMIGHLRWKHDYDMDDIRELGRDG
jgi:predicted RNA-binding Zn-ribbon protein involved in translation (DUF1610 family)